MRKCSVFCLVEIHTVLRMHDQSNVIFNKEFLSKLNPSQQKLVDIYVKRKVDQTGSSTFSHKGSLV